MSIEPDIKDWTWVLERPWQDCWLDASAIDAEEAARYAGVAGEQWERAGRRDNGSWSTLVALARFHLPDVVHHRQDVEGSVR